MTASPPDALVVDSPAAARLLLNPVMRASLEPFFGVDNSVQAAAREARVPLSTMASRVRRFLQEGLLTRSGEARRRGRPMPLYRAPRSIYVPFDATHLVSDTLLSSTTFAQMQQRLMRSVGAAWVEAAHNRTQTLGLHVYRHPGGGVGQNIEPLPQSGEQESAFFEDLLSPEQPAVWDTWGVLHLDHVAAKQFQREMAELKRRYDLQPPGGSRRPYIVRLAVAPLRDD
ncbi:hypothetical protein [Deinococcus hohokamensis]|uniref:ArsR family transcriptional regulator n=1 Tax=Deinococcus hohokamensis TaxID=309883 RepID=A0ABV9ID29_9DEIO